MLPKASIIAVTFLAVALQLNAQSWESLHGPYSGEVVSTLVTSEGTVFAGTALKGVFYRHPDSPFWSRVESQVFDGLQVRALVEFDSSIVAGTASNGIFRSEDGGVTWSPFNIGLQSLSIYEFLVSHDNRLYACTAGGLFRRGDGGEWVQIGDLIQDLSIRTVTENSSGNLFVGAFGAGVFRSTNLGVSWELVDNGLATTTIRSLTVGQADELFLGTFGGQFLQRSLDNGESWTGAADGLHSNGVWSVKVSPDGRLFAGSSGQGVSYSDDGGDTWHTTDAPQTTVSGFAFFEDGDILASSRVGVLRSSDGGETWRVDGVPYSRVNQLVFDDQRLLAGTALGGIHYSDDFGVSWIQTNVNAERILSITKGQDGLLYSSTLEGGVYQSSDGAAWSSIWQSPIHALYSVAADSRGVVFVGTEAGIYSNDPQDPSSDWKLLTHPDARVWTIVIDEGDVIYSGTERQAIWRSADAGETWKQLASDFTQNNESIFRITVLPDGRMAMAPAVAGGVWLSHDQGASWEPSIGLTDIVVSDMTIAPKGSLVAAGFVGQVFELDSDSPEFRPVGSRFNITPIRSIEAGVDGTVYVGTDPVGVYRLPEALVTNTDREVLPDDISITVAAYPNPARTNVRVDFDVIQSGMVALEIFDVVGRLVAERRTLSVSGHQSIQLNVDQLSRGTYFLRMTDSEGRRAEESIVVVR